MDFTTTSTLPLACFGEVTLSSVEDTTLTEVPAACPNLTVAPAKKFAPVTVTRVPPAFGPDPGDTEDTFGGDT
jgi:hypothetical protein